MKMEGREEGEKGIKWVEEAKWEGLQPKRSFSPLNDRKQQNTTGEFKRGNSMTRLWLRLKNGW